MTTDEPAKLRRGIRSRQFASQRERMHRAVQAEQLSSVMNNTKWRQLIAAMRGLQKRGFLVQHHAKDLFGPLPSPTGWDAEWFHHLMPWNSLEWVDIRCEAKLEERHRPPVQLTAEEATTIRSEICTALKANHIPYSIENGRIRVWGYLRSGTSPQWS